jgi:hypothetical protein
MALLIQDGRRGGHLRWATDAVASGVAGGVVISPFHTPRVSNDQNLWMALGEVTRWGAPSRG